MTELAVLVPVLNRPDNVKPLVESFLDNSPVDSILVGLGSYNDPDEQNAWVIALPSNRIRYISSSNITWPEKINFGITIQEADWYLCAADDIEFTPGWWEATKELRDDPQVGVIGTNDSSTASGNPRVTAGEHTCHPLIRGTYIRDFGTIDQPGQAVHPGYHHWCVDDELIWTAKLRNAWAYCPDAVIEHNHPYWQKAEWDDTYTLGEAHAEEDLALWKDRAVRLLGLQLR